MKSTKVLELAKQGDIKAIHLLLNEALKSKNITSQVKLNNSCLQIILNSSEVLEQKAWVNYIGKLFTKLNVDSVQTINILAKQVGDDFPIWTQAVQLQNQERLPVSKSEHFSNQIVTVKPVVTTDKPQLKKIKQVHQENGKNKATFLLFILISLLGLLSVIIFGIALFQRNNQNQALAKAKVLLNHSDISGNSVDINYLKENKGNLKRALLVLDETSNLNFPDSIYSEIITEKQKINEQLDTVEKRIKLSEQLLQEAKQVVRDFAAVNSRLDVGMNYRNYSNQIGDLKVSIDRFSQIPGSKEHPIYKNLNDAFNDYNTALSVWRNYIESDEHDKFFPASSSYGSLLIADYQVESTNIVGQDYIYLDDALTKVWQRASANIELAKNKIPSY